MRSSRAACAFGFHAASGFALERWFGKAVCSAVGACTFNRYLGKAFFAWLGVGLISLFCLAGVFLTAYYLFHFGGAAPHREKAAPPAPPAVYRSDFCLRVRLLGTRFLCGTVSFFAKAILRRPARRLCRVGVAWVMRRLPACAVCGVIFTLSERQLPANVARGVGFSRRRGAYHAAGREERWKPHSHIPKGRSFLPSFFSKKRRSQSPKLFAKLFLEKAAQPKPKAFCQAFFSKKLVNILPQKTKFFAGAGAVLLPGRGAEPRRYIGGLGVKSPSYPLCKMTKR